MEFRAQTAGRVAGLEGLRFKFGLKPYTLNPTPEMPNQGLGYRV